ncbi:MAG: hypoxanthine phosphoribosyltransferase [Chloroflexi bacterium HGW-Chloroflexi-2]|jgi:hypoxanthine phosphoribosyltransferase|nr:MAG: hypoxanthine phosphoribosyltransferase [Chloroflexi bacterium HGW-Chloroflexi-2]
MESYQEFLSEILISEENLKKRVYELGEQISKDYANSSNLILICILRGGVMFLTDLMRAIRIPHAIEFMAVESYGSGSRASSGQVRISHDLNTDIHDRDVILVEDIIDSGHTLSSVLELLSSRKPRSLQVCTLLDKFERREIEVFVKYVGFPILNKFVFGYGLDLDDLYRNLPFVGVVDEEKYKLVKSKQQE